MKYWYTVRVEARHRFAIGTFTWIEHEVRAENDEEAQDVAIADFQGNGYETRFCEILSRKSIVFSK